MKHIKTAAAKTLLLSLSSGLNCEKAHKYRFCGLSGCSGGVQMELKNLFFFVFFPELSEIFAKVTMLRKYN